MSRITNKKCLMKDVLKIFHSITVFSGGEYIQLGKNVRINPYCYFSAKPDGKIIIQDDVTFGPYCIIVSSDHNFSKDFKINKQDLISEDISIGNDVWIASRVTITRGAIIPDGCVIGACSLVTRHCKLKPYCIYGGNPLKKLKER